MSQPFIVPIPDAPGKPGGRVFRATADPTTSSHLPPMAEACKFGTPGNPCSCTGDHTADEASTMRFLGDLWTKARNAKALDHSRRAKIEKLYRGRHYEESGTSSKRLEVTNFCYANVETVAGIFNRSKTMPRVEPIKAMDARKAFVIRETLHWWQNRSQAWMTRSLANRVKTKFGSATLMLTIDPKTGMPFVSHWSGWDRYDDPPARDMAGAEFLILAAPIPTRRLRAMFPKKADKIKPDKYESPAAAVTNLIDKGFYADEVSRNTTLPAITNTASTSGYQGASQPTGSTVLASAAASGASEPGSDTTFFLQFLVRDRTERTYTTQGVVSFPSTIEGDDQAIEYPDNYQHSVPVSESGWRVYFATATGLLDELPLDPCYGGLPIVTDYYVRHEDKIEGIGEIEPIIPIQRSYNERKNMLNRTLRISAVPVLRADKGSGVKFTNKTVEPGDVIEPNKGSNIEWLEYSGPGGEQFNHLQTEKRDMEIVSGVHEALQGIRPEGVETGVAIRELASASATRIQAKMPEGAQAWADVLLKAAKIMRAKLSVPIVFKATNGEILTVSKDDLDGEYTFSFPADESDADAHERVKEEVLTLYQLGIIGRADVLERMEYPDWKNVELRMEQMDMAKAEAEAKAAAENPPPGEGGGGDSKPA